MEKKRQRDSVFVCGCVWSKTEWQKECGRDNTQVDASMCVCVCVCVCVSVCERKRERTQDSTREEGERERARERERERARERERQREMERDRERQRETRRDEESVFVYWNTEHEACLNCERHDNRLHITLQQTATHCNILCVCVWKYCTSRTPIWNVSQRIANPSQKLGEEGGRASVNIEKCIHMYIHIYIYVYMYIHI